MNRVSLIVTILVITIFGVNVIKAQSDLGKNRIDSVVNRIPSLVKSSPNYLVFYIEGAWIPGPLICFLNLDNGTLSYFRITHSNIENSKVIKMKMFKKVKSLILNLTGIKRSIVYVEDGCEGLFFIKKINEIIYSNYFLGRVPEEIREISDLLITLCLK